jgi:antitoxin YefM
MDVLSYSDTRAKLKEVMDRVVDDHTPIVITRQKAEAVVMVSLADWNAMEETVYLLSNPTNAARLREAIRELDAGDLAKRLAPARPADDLVAEGNASRFQRCDQSVEVARLDDDPVPAARFGLAAVRHGSRRGGGGPGEPQGEVATPDDRHCGAVSLDQFKAEPFDVEIRRRADVTYDVPDRRHRLTSSACTPTRTSTR